MPSSQGVPGRQSAFLPRRFQVQKCFSTLHLRLQHVRALPQEMFAPPPLPTASPTAAQPMDTAPVGTGAHSTIAASFIGLMSGCLALSFI